LLVWTLAARVLATLRPALAVQHAHTTQPTPSGRLFADRRVDARASLVVRGGPRPLRSRCRRKPARLLGTANRPARARALQRESFLLPPHLERAHSRRRAAAERLRRTPH